MICDHNLVITNHNAKFVGATHDSFIWSSSQGESFMCRLHQSGKKTWLLGDSGYPQRPWLMTPILNTQSCCVLHNIAQKANLLPPDFAELPADDDEDDFDVEAGPSVPKSQNDLMLGRATFNTLLDRMS